MQRWVAAGLGIVMSIATAGAVGTMAHAEPLSALVISAMAPDANGGYSMRQVVLPVSDADLATPGGADALYVRIGTAAEQACRAPSLRRVTDALRPKFDKCVQDARATAVQRAGLPALSKVAEGVLSAKAP